MPQSSPPLSYPLRRLVREVLQISASACPPIQGRDAPDRPHCKRHNADTRRALVDDANIKFVVLPVDAVSEEYASVWAGPLARTLYGAPPALPRQQEARPRAGTQ
jgi:hypothetical protein